MNVKGDLMKNLMSCYGKQPSAIDPIWTKTLMKLLPDSLTVQQAETLTKRIVLKCKYFPSIAEIMEEYYLYSKELHKGKVLQFPEVRRTYDGRTAKKLHAISEFVKKYKKFPKQPVSPDIIKFARSFFPEMSEETIQRNWLEIANCRMERTRELNENSRYRTVMKLCSDGIIELYVQW